MNGLDYGRLLRMVKLGAAVNCIDCGADLLWGYIAGDAAVRCTPCEEARQLCPDCCRESCVCP